MESICLNCENARRAASQKLEKIGYLGCRIFALQRKEYDVDSDEYQDVSFIGKSKELYEGWVDLKARPFTKSSGVTTNFQLLTVGVTECSKFEKYES